MLIHRSTITPDDTGFPPLQTRLPWFMHVEPSEVAGIVALLVAPAPGYPNGSTVVVDANAPSGLRRVWLSQASKQRLDRAWQG